MENSHLTLHGLLDFAVRDHTDDLQLIGDLLENTINLLVALNKAKLCVFKTTFLGILFDEQARLSEVVSWKTRE